MTSKQINIFILLAIFFFVTVDQTFAQVTLSSIFSDGMVLQQQTDVRIWGWSKSRSIIISTSWNKKSYQVPVNSDGTWRTKISTTKSGGPYTIEIKDENGPVTLSDILLGEVWLASGQSNMEMPLKGFKNQPVTNSEEVIANSENSNIRFFNVKNKSWAKPLNDVEGEWLPASPKTTRDFSATAYFFAKELHEKLNVPVAIIQSDWGGTLVQAWMSSDVLKSFPELEVKAPADSAYSNKNEYAGLYNAMIHPIVGYGIKGAIWYQGEQNRHEPDLYSKLFPAMVNQWRTEWNIGDFPFYYAQIAPYISRTPDRLSANMAQLRPFVPYLRESQMKVENVIPNSGMAVLMDVSSQFTIHPPDKESVGKRLSYHALNKNYGFRDIAYAGPVYKEMEVKGSSTILHFDHAEGLHLKDKSSSVNFIVAGADKVFYPATATVEENTIRVVSDKVKNPVAVRYAFDAWVIGDLFNKHNLPASSFRTDNWSIKEAKNTEIKAPVEKIEASAAITNTSIARNNNQVLAWQFTFPEQSNGRELQANATTVHPNLEMSTLKRGPGVTVQSGSARGFNANFPINEDFSSAEKSGAYYEFTVKAKPGEKVSLSKLDVVLRRQSESAYIYRWTYSINGAKFNKIGERDLEVTDLSNNGSKQPTIDLSGYKELQNVPSSQSITFRLYAWGGRSTQRATSAFGIGKSDSRGSIALNIQGEVTGPIPVKKPLQLSFNSKVWHDRQDKQMFVYVSQNFDGKYESKSIGAAKWINITKEIKWPSHGDDYQSSGEIDLSKHIDPSRPFYIAFRYLTLPLDKNNKKIWSKWSVKDINLVGENNKVLIDKDYDGWNISLSRDYERNNRVRVKSNLIEFLGNDKDKTKRTVGWVISEPLQY